MSDLIRRDDALRSLEEWYARTCKPETLQGLADILAGYSAYKDIAKIPAVDAVEVIRCKYCKHRIEGDKLCAHPKAIGWDAIGPEDDDYCSYGRRREENAVD